MGTGSTSTAPALLSQRVWMPRDGIWVPAVQLDEDEDHATVILDGGEIISVPTATRLLRRNNESFQSTKRRC